MQDIGDHLVLEKFMVETIHPALAKHFCEWKQRLDANGCDSSHTGLFIITQIIGFGMHTYLFNNPDADKDEYMLYLSNLFDEVRTLFDLKRGPPQ